MSQLQQDVHMNKKTHEPVTFVTVRATTATDAIRNARRKLQKDIDWSEFSIVHMETDEIYVVKVSKKSRTKKSASWTNSNT